VALLNAAANTEVCEALDAVRQIQEVLVCPLLQHRSRRAKLTPPLECGGAAFLESLSADEGAFLVEPKVREANWL